MSAPATHAGVGAGAVAADPEDSLDELDVAHLAEEAVQVLQSEALDAECTGASLLRKPIPWAPPPPHTHKSLHPRDTVWP